MNNKMVINTYLSTTESEKQNKWTNRIETDSYRYREHFGSGQMGWGFGGWVKKVKGLRSTDW